MYHPMTHPIDPIRRLALGTLALVATVALVACYPPAYRVEPRPDTPAPPPSTRLYFYPAEGQSLSRQDRDRYECHLWAVRKSGFDPGLTPLAPHQRVDVVAEPPPGSDTAAGAIGGAMVGAILASPHDTGEGMLFGAITGAMLGAASDTARQETAREIQHEYDARYARQYASAERQAHNYRRAMTACLEGRGYTVR